MVMGWVFGRKEKEKIENSNSTPRSLSSKLGMRRFNTRAVKSSGCFTWKKWGRVLWSDAGNNVTYSAGLPDCLPPPSISLSVSLCVSHLLYLVYFCLIEKRRVPVSENKDAKQRQIELLFGVLLVTTVPSGDFGLLLRKGRDRRICKDEVTGCH